MAGMLLLGACSPTEGTISEGDWELAFDKDSHTYDYYYQGKKILSGVFPRVKIGESFISSKDFPVVSVTQFSVNDVIGDGEGYNVTFSGGEGDTLRLEQNFVFYDDAYFLTGVSAVSLTGRDISSNHMAPVCTETASAFLPADSTNRVLRVPFDNDGFVRYQSLPLDCKVLSFEGTAIFNGQKRTGLVLGSVEHDTWKTGIAVSGAIIHAADPIEATRRFIEAINIY